MTNAGANLFHGPPRFIDGHRSDGRNCNHDAGLERYPSIDALVFDAVKTATEQAKDRVIETGRVRRREEGREGRQAKRMKLGEDRYQAERDIELANGRAILAKMWADVGASYPRGTSLHREN